MDTVSWAIAVAREVADEWQHNINGYWHGGVYAANQVADTLGKYPKPPKVSAAGMDVLRKLRDIKDCFDNPEPITVHVVDGETRFASIIWSDGERPRTETVALHVFHSLVKRGVIERRDDSPNGSHLYQLSGIGRIVLKYQG